METQNVNLPIQNEKKGMVKPKTENANQASKPTASFIGASWITFFIGLAAYCIGLWNSDMLLNEKGYYFAVILFSLFAVVSVQKSVRDKAEGVPVTEIYYGISWFATIISILLLVIGLWNADLWLSEKGFFGMSFLLAIYSAVSVQKNTRDLKLWQKNNA